MSWRSESIWIEFIVGSRKTSNFCWAFILFFGSLGFLLVGTSSYLGRNLISLFPSQQIVFFPQGIVMSFNKPTVITGLQSIHCFEFKFYLSKVSIASNSNLISFHTSQAAASSGLHLLASRIISLPSRKLYRGRIWYLDIICINALVNHE